MLSALGAVGARRITVNALGPWSARSAGDVLAALALRVALGRALAVVVP